MQLGGVLAVVVVVGYVGFELHAIGQNKYRTEKDFVYQQFIGAQQAQQLCGGSEDQVADFERNLKSVTRRATETVKSKQPELDEAGLIQAMAELASSARSEVTEVIDSNGCKDIEAFKLMKRYEYLAGLNLP